MLASILGGAALSGGFFGGTIADRIGGAVTFAVVSFVQVAACAFLVMSTDYAFIAVCVAVIGVCANALIPVVERR